MRPGRHLRNRDCLGRIYNPPLQVWCGFQVHCRGRCPHRPVPRRRPKAGGRLGEPPLQVRCGFQVHCRGRCPHRPVPRRRKKAGGRLGEPPLRVRCGFRVHCRGRCPHRPVPRRRPKAGGRLGGPPLQVRCKMVQKRMQPQLHPFCNSNYLAYSTALVSRMTLTLIWPGYSSSLSIFLASSRARRIMLSSLTSSGLTMMRTSRPAWMA